MCIEGAFALFAAIHARSIALLGFGADSIIELASALVVLLRFQRISRINEAIASRITGFLLFALAAFVLGSSLLVLTNPRLRPEPSYMGIVVLVAAGLVMPWLSKRKRTLAAKTRSTALKADAVQSSMCAYLAWIALVGVLLNVLFGFSWADPVAAVLLLPIIIREGWDTIQGKVCADCAG